MFGKEHLSGADNSWRRLGTIDNLTNITGVLVFDGQMTYEELCDQLERRLLRFDRFTEAIGGRKRTIRRPYWDEMDDFNIDTHVHELNLAEPRGQEQLQDFVGTLMSRPLDEARPLWEIYLLQEYEGGSAIVARLNHSMADGFALMYVLFGLADDPNAIEFPIGGLSTPDLPEAEREGRATAASTNGGAEHATGPVSENSGADSESPDRDADVDADRETDDSVDRDSESGRSDSSGDSGLLGGLKLAGNVVKTAGGLLLMDDEPQTSLHDDIGTKKTAAWTDNMDLAPVKDIGKVHDATINTVLLGATAGVFRRTLESRGEDVADLELRCTVPVNLKPMDKRDESLGNYFGLAFVPIPVHAENLDERIDIIRERSSREKLGIQAYIMYQVLDLGGYLPEQLFNLGSLMFQHNATAVVSNVPGPKNTIEIAGHEVEKIMFWNPQAVDQGLSVSIFTYDGGVRVGVSGDAKIIPQPEQLTDAFEDEIAMLEEKYL